MGSRFTVFFTLFCTLNVASLLHADVRLPALFTDHAVLQRDQELTVWGWADSGENVVVTLGTSKSQTTADGVGCWSLKLAPQSVSREPLTMVVEGRNRIEVRDILLGDVWLCSGQSNMEFPLGACDASEDIQAASFPLIRQFGVELNFAQAPQKDVKGQWATCSPQTSTGFTAIGFYFARRIHTQTGIPIGLLRSSVGGTNIECWMSQDTLLNTPELKPYARIMRDSLADYQKELATALPEIEAWTAASRAAMLSGNSIPLPPTWPEFPFGERRFRPRCVTLHNGMIAPLVPTSLKGVLWYQGENNAGGPFECEQYIAKKQAMIRDWREWFHNPDLPFYFVQLASWQPPHDRAADADGWALFRDAQRRCVSRIPRTGMVVAIDVGDADDIHPKNKFDLGERLARWALSENYGVAMEVSGPLFRELTIEGSVARISFNHTDSGLMVGRKTGRNPVEEAKGVQLQRFAISGADRHWYWADATIDGDSVKCSHPEVKSPVAIRYACSMNPAGANLYNRDGLPASPFRTDDW